MNIIRQWFHGLVSEKTGHPDVSSIVSRSEQNEDKQSFAYDHNEFSLAIYDQLPRKRRNLFFSPFSVRSVLAMSYSGARGETAAQMRETLRFPSTEDTLHLAFSKIIQRLNAQGSGKELISVANSLWGQDSEPFKDRFLELLDQHYGSGLHPVDFRKAAEAARVDINQWVEQKTNRKIKNLIPSGNLSNEARLVLVNAAYFMGKWELKFNGEYTQDHSFYLEGGGEVQAPLMFQNESVLHMTGKGFQAIELPYMSGEISMMVILPDKKDGLKDLESKLSARTLFGCTAQMVRRQIMLLLPKFKITWGTFDFGEQLADLGMPLAFKPLKADFSGINGYEPPHLESLYISSIFHKAFVEVNEEGTEAAAASGSVMITGSAGPIDQPQPKIFKADHPFLFAIRDRKTGTILFLGRLAHPTR